MKTNGLASAEAAAQAVAAKAAVARLEPEETRLVELERRLEAMEAGVLASQQRVLESHEHLIRRVNELAATLAALYRETRTLASRPKTIPGAASGRDRRTSGDARALTAEAPWETAAAAPVDYDALVRRVRSMIEATVPPGSQVCVVSRGDPTLLELDGRTARHFPAENDGSWAGFHPEDSEAAIEHLERSRGLGVGYFVLPHASYWWLEYYDAFAHYLDARYRLIAASDDTARIYALDETGGGMRGSA